MCYEKPQERNDPSKSDGLHEGGDVKIYFFFEIRDMWMGLFWKDFEWGRSVYICLLPCCVIQITYERR